MNQIQHAQPGPPALFPADPSFVESRIIRRSAGDFLCPEPAQTAYRGQCAMHVYRVVFGDRDLVKFGTKTIEALGLSDALIHSSSLRPRQPVELWQDQLFLGRMENIANAEGSFWRIVARGH